MENVIIHRYKVLIVYTLYKEERQYNHTAHSRSNGTHLFQLSFWKFTTVEETSVTEEHSLQSHLHGLRQRA